MTITLKGERRSVFGKKIAKLRQAGFVPGILYGEKLSPLPFSVKAKDLKKIYGESGKTMVIDFELSGENQETQKYRVLFKDVQVHPVTDHVLHIDLYQIPSHKITVKVPLVFVGKSEAESQGGILIKNHKELTVSGLADKLPKEITIDISALKKIGDQIKVKDVPVLKDLEIKEGLDEVIVFAFMRRAAEEISAENVASVSGQGEFASKETVQGSDSVSKDRKTDEK